MKSKKKNIKRKSKILKGGSNNNVTQLIPISNNESSNNESNVPNINSSNVENINLYTHNNENLPPCLSTENGNDFILLVMKFLVNAKHASIHTV